MVDITKCVNKKCKLRKSCWRFLCMPCTRQSYAKFGLDEKGKAEKKCSYYWRWNPVGGIYAE